MILVVPPLAGTRLGGGFREKTSDVTAKPHEGAHDLTPQAIALWAMRVHKLQLTAACAIAISQICLGLRRDDGKD